MIFNEIGFYILFLLPCVAAFHLVPRGWRFLAIGLYGTGFFIYFGYLHFGGLWGALAVLIFYWELLTTRLYRPGSRWCIFGIVQAVCILAAFKYLIFFTGAWNDLAGAWMLPRLESLPRLILLLGVSFFTFEFIHYAADCYAGRIKGSTIRQYMGFIYFFPTMVAGPIKRFQEFTPQVETARFDPRLAVQGAARIAIGLVKKHVLSDTFALWSDQLNTQALYTADRFTILGWVLAYGMKIYFDFSGYSDIAIGSGNLFGVRIPENFNWPYLSRNIAEFWRRWHISLGRWIFDYIYTPLGGSLKGEYRTALNLGITFGLSGLWHGAAYNFVVWGLWHGVLMIVHRFWKNHLVPRGLSLNPITATVLTFFSVNIGWAFFCMDFPRACYALKRIFWW